MPSPTEILKRIFLFAQLEAVTTVTADKASDEKGPGEVDDDGEDEDEDEAPHSLGEMIAIRKFVKDVSSAATRFSSRLVHL
jgi:hypothetical protein